LPWFIDYRGDLVSRCWGAAFVPKKVESCFGDGDLGRKWSTGVNGKQVAG